MWVINNRVCPEQGLISAEFALRSGFIEEIGNLHSIRTPAGRSPDTPKPRRGTLGATRGPLAPFA